MKCFVRQFIVLGISLSTVIAPAVRRYVKSQLEAVDRIWTDKETSLKVLSKYMGGIDRHILEKTWEILTNEAVLPKNSIRAWKGSRPCFCR
jgi:hypothetical protein